MVCSPLQNLFVQDFPGPIQCRNFARPVSGEGAALATFRPWGGREVLGEIAGPSREGAAVLGSVGPPLTPRSVVLCAGKYGLVPPGTPHRGGVGMEGLEAVLGLD